MSAPPRIAVAIPARDEAALLPKCLAALGRQTGTAFDALTVVVACNNCTDDTGAVARAMAGRLPFRLVVAETVLPLATAHAGGARRYAMDMALGFAGADGLLLTTDADAVADGDWVAAMADAFARGADAVAGRVDTDWDELSKFPPDVLATGAAEWDYQLLSAELDARLDPRPDDPWPRHNQTCGANAAIRADWYRRIGGLPVVRTGEDGAMFDAVFRRDGVIRHAMRPHVTASARLSGRAEGGMADALAARHGDDYLCDDLLEPADDLARRARWRAAARQAHAEGRLGGWARRIGIPASAIAQAVPDAPFGATWRLFEATTPALAKHRIAADAIVSELARIRALLAEIQPTANRTKR